MRCAKELTFCGSFWNFSGFCEFLFINYFIIYSVIPDSGPAASNASSVKKIIFCSGRVYYDLTKARRERKLEDNIAISRVEQVN